MPFGNRPGSGSAIPLASLWNTQSKFAFQPASRLMFVYPADLSFADTASAASRMCESTSQLVPYVGRVDDWTLQLLQPMNGVTNVVLACAAGTARVPVRTR